MFKHPNGDIRHGTLSAYRFDKCRCPQCLAKHLEGVRRTASNRRLRGRRQKPGGR